MPEPGRGSSGCAVERSRRVVSGSYAGWCRMPRRGDGCGETAQLWAPVGWSLSGSGDGVSGQSPKSDSNHVRFGTPFCQDEDQGRGCFGYASRDEKTETENKYRQRTGTGDCRGYHKCPFSGGGAGKSGSSIRLRDRDDGVATGRRQGLAISRIEPLCTCMCRYTRRPGHSAIAAPVTSRFVVVWYSNLAQKEQQVARTGRARACLPHGTKPAP